MSEMNILAADFAWAFFRGGKNSCKRIGLCIKKSIRSPHKMNVNAQVVLNL